MPPAGKAGDAKAAAPAAAPADAAAKPAAKDAKGKAKPKAKPLKEGADPAAPGAEDGGAGTADAAAAPQPTGADEAPALPTDTFEGILPLLDWESIPDREKFEKGVLSELKAQSANLMSAFVCYGKASSECSTAELATKIHLAGLKKLMLHASFETPMLPADNVIRLFGKCATGTMPAKATAVGESTMVDLKGFLSFCLQLAFYRANPRYGLLSTAAAPAEGAAPKKELQVSPVGPAVKTFLAETLSKMHKSTAYHFNNMLAADRTVQ